MIPKKEPEAVQAFLARPETSLMGVERQLRFCLLMGLTGVSCPMCFEPVNRYEAGDETQAVGEFYEGKYICPYCDTELAYCVPFIMQPGTPGWHWRRKEPIPNRKSGPNALARYYIEMAQQQGAVVGNLVYSEQKTDAEPPTDRGPSARPTISPRNIWYVASCENGRAIIRDQNTLFVAEVIADNAELIAAVPELFEHLDHLLREHPVHESLVLIERLRRD